MKRIKTTGSAFRHMVLENHGITQKEIAKAIGLHQCQVSDEINSNIFKVIDNKKRILIYDYYKNRVMRPISYDDFWANKKVFEEVR